MESLYGLLVGASASAAARLVRELRVGGYTAVVRDAHTGDDLRRALDGTRWDVVFVDRPPPALSVLDVLALIREHAPATPVLIVSDEIHARDALAAMRAGAADYFTWADLPRLVPALARELRAAADRRTGHQAQEALRLSEGRTNALLTKSFDGVVMLDAQGRARFVSASIRHILGYSAGDLLGTSPVDMIHPADLPRAMDVLTAVLRRPGGGARIVYRLRHKAGAYRWLEALVTNLLAEPSVRALVLNLRDVTERVETHAVREHLAAIVDSTADAILRLSVHDVIETWNAGATTLFGYVPGEAIGRHISFLVPPGRRREQRQVLAAARRGWGRIDYETVRRHKDGRLIDVAITLSPIPGPDGVVDGVSVIARDSTARRRAAEALDQARATAEAVAEQQRAFVATTSHELRTPLTVMVGFGELLLARWAQLAEAQRMDHVQKIVAAAHRQQRLVEDLLLLSQLEGGTLAPARATMPVGALVHRAADETIVIHPGQELRLDGPADLLVRVDPDRVVQIVTNLLDNAAKYSPEGAAIDVWWRAEGDRAVLRVRDRGAGVPARHVHLLFARFSRIPGSPIRAGRVGTGLGLYVSRELARAMGGEVDLESTGADGSTFRLALPSD